RAISDVVWGEIYRSPGLGRRPGIILTLGANELGGRDPRAIALADTLARSGFVVLMMCGAPAVVDPVADAPAALARAPARAAAAFDFLSTRVDVDQSQIGFVGVCLGGG